jgi:hypothetical protein
MLAPQLELRNTEMLAPQLELRHTEMLAPQLELRNTEMLAPQLELRHTKVQQTFRKGTECQKSFRDLTLRKSRTHTSTTCTHTTMGEGHTNTTFTLRSIRKHSDDGETKRRNF